MVLEAIIRPNTSKLKPWHFLLLGMLYSAVALFLSLWIFKDESSLVMVFLTVLACVPLIHGLIVKEENKDTKIKNEKKLFREHWKLLMSLLYLFLGFVLTYTILFIFLPEQTVATLFETQLFTIQAINSNISGDFAGSGFLSLIMANNLKVLFFCVLFSFFYGAGAIFILTWNATIISAAIGTFIRNGIETYVTSLGWSSLATYFHIISIGFLRYMTHGILEVLAYFVGGLAGGIISVAMIRHSTDSKKFSRVMRDAINLLIFAIVLLVMAAIVEVYVSPWLG
ncbi:MAG: stage II sporulation protein M [archaeon]